MSLGRTLGSRLSGIARAATVVLILLQASGCMPAADPGDTSDGTSSRSLVLRGGVKTTLVAFDTSPFPYRGDIPDQNKPFLNIVEGERLGHASPRGATYWEDQTYSDHRVLLSIPRGFSLRRPAAIVVYFHGNNATLERDVRDRQQVPRQVADSGLNAVLVAPQFAVDARDSSAGRFWEPGAFRQFLDEAAGHLARLSGDPDARSRFASLPVILVAYSGGYLPAAYTLDVGDVGGRVAGVVLLDALYGEADRFAAWVSRRDSAFLVSAYSRSTRPGNEALQRTLRDKGVGFETGLSSRLGQGSITFVDAGDAVEHNDFVTRAWTADPLRAVLAKVPGLSRS
jgi:hypothetical protein